MNQSCSNYLNQTLTGQNFRYGVFGLFLVAFLFLFSSNDFSYDSDKSVASFLSEERSVEKELTKENLRLELDLNHIICPEQVYAQVLIESNHLNSFLSKRTNNVIGMRYPFKRTTAAVGIFLPDENLIIIGSQEELRKYRNKNNYAVYKNWQDCIKDYKYWQEQSFKLTELYLAFLGKTYAEDTNYVKKIKSIAQ